MRKVILVYGLLAGVIVMPMILLLVFGDHSAHGDMTTSMIVGFANMALAFSMIFFGIAAYKKNYVQDRLTFGKAFTIGLGITFIASTVYSVSWFILMKSFYPDFFEQYCLAMAQGEGLTGAALEEYMLKKQPEIELYKHWYYAIPVTYVEILPMGILMTLIASFIFRGKKKQRSAVTA